MVLGFLQLGRKVWQDSQHAPPHQTDDALSGEKLHQNAVWNLKKKKHEKIKLFVDSFVESFHLKQNYNWFKAHSKEIKSII